MKCDKNMMLLYAVTDRTWTGEKTLYMQVEEALRGGVTCVQLREKQLSGHDFLEEALKIKALCSAYHVPLFINDHVEVAVACRADGIHVGQEDMHARDVRSLVGDHMMLGVSVHTVEEAKAAVENGADYLGVGAMFSTATKPDADVLSLQTLHDICHAVDVPVVAIGGLNQENIPHLAGTGVCGVALVSAIFAADNITKTCKDLRSLIENVVNTPVKNERSESL